MKLYHGTLQNIEKTLKPNKAFPREDYNSVVYLTDIKEIAIAYAISPIDSYIKEKFAIIKHYPAISAHIRFHNDKLEIMECYPGMFDIYKRSAYIYVCDIDMAKDGHEYQIDHNLDFSDKIYIPDVYQELMILEKQGKVKLYKYDDLKDTYWQYDHMESGLQNRAGICQSDEERAFFKMVSNYFPNIKNHIK